MELVRFKLDCEAWIAVPEGVDAVKYLIEKLKTNPEKVIFNKIKSSPK